MKYAFLYQFKTHHNNEISTHTTKKSNTNPYFIKNFCVSQERNTRPRQYFPVTESILFVIKAFKLYPWIFYIQNIRD